MNVIKVQFKQPPKRCFVEMLANENDKFIISIVAGGYDCITYIIKDFVPLYVPSKVFIHEVKKCLAKN